MTFQNLLIHSLIEIPTVPSTTPVTSYLPKSAGIEDKASAYLFYPQAFGHITMPSGMHLSFRPVPSYGILYVSQGKGSLSFGDRHCPLSGNCFVLFDLREGFSFSASTVLEYDVLYFSGSSMPYFYEQIEKNDGLFQPSFSSAGLNGVLRPLLSDSAQTLSPFAFHRLVTDLLSELVEYTSASEGSVIMPDYLPHLKEYLDENFFKDISLDLLEKQFSVNRYRLCREFREYYFLPPLQYLHMARIAKAKLLLTETTLKIHEISYQVGYENQNQFIHHFKKITGRTPASYRERKK